MFPLRLVRGYRALDLARWLLTAAAAATAAAFLLRSLGRALGEPAATSVPRLLWCLPALAAVGWLSAAAARAVPAQHPERIAASPRPSYGPVRIRLLIAVETALAAALGSVLALLLFLVLRNDIAGPGLAADVGLGSSLPAAAPVTLLVLVPLVAGCAAAAAVPLTDALPGRTAVARSTGFHPARIAVPVGFTVVGMALELYGLRPGAEQDGRPVDLPAHLGSVGTAALIGWALTALGLALLTAPLLALAGRVLALRRPARCGCSPPARSPRRPGRSPARSRCSSSASPSSSPRSATATSPTCPSARPSSWSPAARPAPWSPALWRSARPVGR
ncbi:hypothetical protein ACFQ1I_30070 [Kitasatospora arboriphila]